MREPQCDQSHERGSTRSSIGAVLALLSPAGPQRARRIRGCRLGCRHPLERKCRRGRHRGLHRASRQPIPRIAHLRDDAHRHPRCPQRYRSPLPSVRVRRAGATAALLRMPPLLRRHEMCWSRSSVNSRSSSSPQSCIDAGVASVEADYTAALAAIPDSPGQGAGHRAGTGRGARRSSPCRAADGAVGPFLNFNCPQDTDPWRVPVHTGYPVHRL